MFVKELRARQPQLSLIDENLLIEVAGVEPDHAKLLCTNFELSWLLPSTWNEYMTGGAKMFADGFRSYRDELKSIHAAWKSIQTDGDHS